ncbi:hypothetical protein JCM5350_007708 [Sporobolomyces pararoseus]
MNSCGSPERHPRRVRTTYFGPYLRFLAERFNLLLDDRVPTTNFILVPDGMMCAVLCSFIVKEIRSDPSDVHPACEVLLTREMQPDLLNRASEPQLKFRLPRITRSSVTEEYLDINVCEPTSFPLQPFTEFFCHGALHGQEFQIPLSCTFYASSLHRLRQLARQAQLVSQDLYKYRKVKIKIYVHLCSILLYFLSISDDETAATLGFTREEWRATLQLADRYTEEGDVFGTFGYRQNQNFLREHRESFEQWSREASEWWTEGRLHRSYLRDGFRKMSAALYHVFDLESQQAYLLPLTLGVLLSSKVTRIAENP